MAARRERTCLTNGSDWVHSCSSEARCSSQHCNEEAEEATEEEEGVLGVEKREEDTSEAMASCQKLASPSSCSTEQDEEEEGEGEDTGAFSGTPRPSHAAAIESRSDEEER